MFSFSIFISPDSIWSNIASSSFSFIVKTLANFLNSFSDFELQIFSIIFEAKLYCFTVQFLFTNRLINL